MLHCVWKAQWLHVTRFSQIVACLPFVTGCLSGNWDTGLPLCYENKNVKKSVFFLTVMYTKKYCA